MRVLVMGAHGAVGQKLLPVLRKAGHQVLGMIRDGDQAPTIRSLGAEPVVGDLEGDFGRHLDGCDAVIFTAGSGGGTGADKTVAVDGLGAIRAVDAASEHGARRFVMVSALGAGDPDRSETIRHYLVAKGIADGYLERSGLDYTILRPGRLTDEEPTGLVRLDDDGEGGSVTRADVAHVAALCLVHRNTVETVLPLLNGETPVEEALRGV